MTIVVEDIPEDLMIYIKDVTKAGICASGTRRWFPAHGLDFKDFLANGITARDLFATNDAYATRVVTMKMQRDG